MQKARFSRRDFLKATLLGFGATFLAACEYVLGVTETPPPTSAPVATEPPEATEPPTVEPTEPPTEEPTEPPATEPSEISCFKLLTPENGAKVPVIGKVTFSWEAMTGAKRYQLQFTLPSGQALTFETEDTSKIRFIESFLAGGVYTWQVAAFDENSAVICITESFTFEKPVYTPPQNNGEGGGSDSGSGNPPPPGHSESGQGG